MLLCANHLLLQIQVVEDDRRNKEGLFETGQRGALPPLVTTDFIVEDRGMVQPLSWRLLSQDHVTKGVANAISNLVPIIGFV